MGCPAFNSPISRLAELALVALAAVLLVELGLRLAAGLARSGAWHWLPIGLVLGVACADLTSGLVHWFCDSFFSAETPLIGRLLIRPFRDHHAAPEAMVGHGLLELHANSCAPVVAALALARLLPFEPSHATLFQAWLFFFALTAASTNQLHLWAHAESRPPVVRWLQRHGVILTPERHALHHSSDFSRSYCVATGWLNPALDRAGLFPRLERGIRSLARS
jgi:hypothetical protein